MKIAKNTVVTLNYSLYNHEGLLLDKTEEPMEYLQGDYDNIIPAVEEALEGQEAGHKIDIQITAEDAFGEFDPELIIEEDKENLPGGVEVGMMFDAEDPETGDLEIFTVKEIKGNIVVLDGNHPFAGVDVRFEGEVVAVRAATAEEIAHGHVHGADGHHDDH